jgi:aminoglycoside phosphotransferase (APT) family kinase protein
VRAVTSAAADSGDSTEIRGIDRPRVDAFLVANVPAATAPFRYDLVAAGGSNLTFRVRDSAGHQWALRRPPVGHTLPTAHDMSREWRIMAALAPTNVPVPECVAYCDDRDVNGAAFYVMGFVDGRILRRTDDASDLTPEQADTATDALIDVQIAFHTADLAAIGLSDLGKHDDYVGRQLKRWKGQVERDNVRDIPLLHELHDQLMAAKPPETAPPGLAHGDYRFDNCVLRADFQIAAVLDWELCTIGDPIADFAWSIQYWADPGDEFTWLPDAPTTLAQFPRKADVIERYAERSGFDLGKLSYYDVFSWWKQACIVEGAYARRLRGATGGMGGTGNVSSIADRVDQMLARAADLADGVL